MNAAPAYSRRIVALVADYMDPAVLPNRRHRLVLRRHSRSRVRDWLLGLDDMSEHEIGEQFQPVIMGRFRVSIPDRPRMDKTVRKLTIPAEISPEDLDAYLDAHPEALVGNAEADLCRRHTGYLRDIPALRQTLTVLLDASIEVAHRLDLVLDGPYRLHGLGSATATTIVECWNDGLDEGPVDGLRYSKWTGHTERALSKLDLVFRATAPGRTYENIWEIQREMLYNFPEFESLSDVDLFMCFLDPRGLNAA